MNKSSSAEAMVILLNTGPFSKQYGRPGMRSNRVMLYTCHIQYSPGALEKILIKNVTKCYKADFFQNTS